MRATSGVLFKPVAKLKLQPFGRPVKTNFQWHAPRALYPLLGTINNRYFGSTSIIVTLLRELRLAEKRTRRFIPFFGEQDTKDLHSRYP